MWRSAKIGAAVFTVVALVGCQTTKEEKQILGGVGGGVVGGLIASKFGSGSGRIIATIAGAAVGAWLGTKFADLLSKKDQSNLATSTHQAALSGQPQRWKNPDTGVSGITKVRKTTTKTKSSQIRILKDRVKETPPIEFINKTYVALKNSNVRGGPNTNYVIVDSLVSGSKTVVLGKVQGQDWYLISKNGAGAGYVYAPLMKQVAEEPVVVQPTPPSPSDDVVEVTIASGQTCRIITQEVTLDNGSVEEDEVTVCNGPNGWVVS